MCDYLMFFLIHFVCFYMFLCFLSNYIGVYEIRSVC